ncbi:uncharacterized protein F4812DRAFT_469696 [Daldinia caldariorum]|uniref:uncharacterized protein n=1 Tax=Daldinia caldariorum TaxID=326644 RepID=UPI002007B9A2|nr:uncharacterized protein F4812DRAFT_469696 [Daldinia caldariorum]KAI1462898.1 hypothetical protein F4812DRAFT_469696 [Daldinia caldariorum]
MYVPGFALLCLCTLTTIVDGLAGGRRPAGMGMNKYISSFLGGVVINVNQTETTRQEDKLPALRTVSAEWNVPWIRAPDNASLSDSDKRHSLAQWVGILGNDCDNVNWYPFLQAGTLVEINGNGMTTASAWVKWFPAAARLIPKKNFEVIPDDKISVAVEVYTRISGHV